MSTFSLQVYIEPPQDEDYLFILRTLYPRFPSDLIQKMVHFSSVLSKECGIKWGVRGAPWEINLRDLIRWCCVMQKYHENERFHPGRFVALIYANRMRTADDREKVGSFLKKYTEVKFYQVFYILFFVIFAGSLDLWESVRSNIPNFEKVLTVSGFPGGGYFWRCGDEKRKQLRLYNTSSG